ALVGVRGPQQPAAQAVRGRLTVIASPYLEGRDRYERRMTGRVDAMPADALTHTVHLADEDGAVELVAVCTPSPGYEVLEAHGAVLGGSADPAIAADFSGLAGAPPGGGGAPPRPPLAPAPPRARAVGRPPPPRR